MSTIYRMDYHKRQHESFDWFVSFYSIHRNNAEFHLYNDCVVTVCVYVNENAKEIK